MYRYNIDQKNNTVYCIFTKTFNDLYNRSKTITVIGKAKCSPDDKFDEKIGQDIAYKRALIKYLKVVRSEYEEILKYGYFDRLLRFADQIENISRTIETQSKELSTLVSNDKES